MLNRTEKKPGGFQSQMPRIEVIEDEQALRGLSRQWTDLAGRVPGCLFIQTYDWCVAGWAHISRGCGLKCLTVWNHAELVGIWPFVVTQVKGARRLDLLGSGLGDNADPLIDPAYESYDLCRLMLDKISQHADILNLPFLAVGSSMHRAVCDVKGWRKVSRFEDFTIDSRGSPSWDVFMNSYSKNMRHHLRSSRRKLGERGQICFEIATHAEGQLEVIDWMFREKRLWLERNKISNDWYYNSASRAFLIDLADRPQLGQHMALFSLKLDGAIIAADVCAVGADEISGLIITFDPEFRSYSPGMLLVQDIAHWAFERKLAFGLMSDWGLEKERWATRTMARETHLVAYTLRGLPYMVSGYLGESVRKTMGRIKALSQASRARMVARASAT
jgi:CelD/BcsL family acetyltransferase involved in cellulose biosynthesis